MKTENVTAEVNIHLRARAHDKLLIDQAVELLGSSRFFLNARHDLQDFHSGEEALDSWLRKHALANMETGASKSYVICPSDTFKVIGY